MRWVLLGIVVLGGCRASAKPASAAPDANENAAQIVGRYCDGCHDTKVSADNTAALEVFDLQDPDWTVRMTDEQLRESVVRLAGTRGPTKDNPATADEVETLRTFITATLAERT